MSQVIEDLDEHLELGKTLAPQQSYRSGGGILRGSGDLVTRVISQVTILISTYNLHDLLAVSCFRASGI